MDKPTECPECGMPVTRGKVTNFDFETGESYDAGGYVHWTCAGLMGSGPGSAACKEIARLKDENERLRQSL